MSWRDNIQICMDVPTEVCNAKGGNCDECSIDRVLEALKAKGRHQTLVEIGIGITAANCPWSGSGWLVFIPEEAE